MADGGDSSCAENLDLCEEIFDSLEGGISIIKEDISLSSFEVKGAIIEGTEVLLATSVNIEPQSRDLMWTATSFPTYSPSAVSTCTCVNRRKLTHVQRRSLQTFCSVGSF